MPKLKPEPSNKPNAEQLIKRLNIIEGQVRGVKKMVTNDAYCIDVMKQIKSIKNALERVNALALEGHMKTCVTTRLRSDDPNEREKVITEVVEVFNATGKL
jgi:DNA-binding FrmR family transcriptional regulator